MRKLRCREAKGITGHATAPWDLPGSQLSWVIGSAETWSSRLRHRDKNKHTSGQCVLLRHVLVLITMQKLPQTRRLKTTYVCISWFRRFRSLIKTCPQSLDSGYNNQCSSWAALSSWWERILFQAYSCCWQRVFPSGCKTECPQLHPCCQLEVTFTSLPSRFHNMPTSFFRVREGASPWGDRVFPNLTMGETQQRSIEAGFRQHQNLRRKGDARIQMLEDEAHGQLL